MEVVMTNEGGSSNTAIVAIVVLLFVLLIFILFVGIGPIGPILKETKVIEKEVIKDTNQNGGDTDTNLDIDIVPGERNSRTNSGNNNK
jgi:hypothetical protein